ncbi:hypothetical protein N7466_004878 [Penicillium verhagenii]|uniref:uncharacterized protein n=1 Tax=Penicillium verhagenii TaxID=1562060 RepID=UPI002545ADB2|nr:uncharacterized protein N7466_004878 [Penicillium verhagenii]KAJ5935331.1 hypothetical protein N7466_004878 [Penicillium verhagenii]
MKPEDKANQPPAEPSPQIPVPPSLVIEEGKAGALDDTTGLSKSTIKNRKKKIRKKAMRELLKQEDDHASREISKDTHVPDPAESSAQGLTSSTSTISPHALALEDKVALPASSAPSSSGSDIYYTPESGRSGTY